MKIVEKGKIELNQKLFALAITEEQIFTGGTSKTLHKLDINLQNEKILCKHKKSIRCIQAKDDLIICGSYDGNATVIYQDRVLDLIEGPETEIKGVDILNSNRNENFLALSTRGKTVWVCKLNEKIEIDSILEDHTQDVKGVKFHDDLLYTYGYDNTVKVYQRFTMYDDSWVLLQSLDAQKETVWDLAILNKLFVACNDGFIYTYKKSKDWVFENSFNISVYPIFSICTVKQHLAVIVESKSIVLFDEDLNVKYSLIDIHKKDINCLKYLESICLLATCSDDGFLKTFEVKL